VDFVGAAVPELDALDVGFGLMLGGGSARLVLSLGGAGGGGSKEDEDGIREEIFPLVMLFGAVLPIFPIGGRVSAFVAGGGGGISRLGPFIGGGAALSPSSGG
jgi:hypothetical protein